MNDLEIFIESTDVSGSDEFAGVLYDSEYFDISGNAVSGSPSEEFPLVYAVSEPTDYSDVLSNIDNSLNQLVYIGSTIQALLLLILCVPKIKSVGRRLMNRKGNDRE